MRSHPVYVTFNRRWQLPIYFQLRWKEIVGKLEDSLAITGINPDRITHSGTLFLSFQARMVLWAPQVVLRS